MEVQTCARVLVEASPKGGHSLKNPEVNNRGDANKCSGENPDDHDGGGDGVFAEIVLEHVQTEEQLEIDSPAEKLPESNENMKIVAATAINREISEIVTSVNNETSEDSANKLVPPHREEAQIGKMTACILNKMVDVSVNKLACSADVEMKDDNDSVSGNCKMNSNEAGEDSASKTEFTYCEDVLMNDQIATMRGNSSMVNNDIGEDSAIKKKCTYNEDVARTVQNDSLCGNNIMVNNEAWDGLANNTESACSKDVIMKDQNGAVCANSIMVSNETGQDLANKVEVGCNERSTVIDTETGKDLANNVKVGGNKLSMMSVECYEQSNGSDSSQTKSTMHISPKKVLIEEKNQDCKLLNDDDSLVSSCKAMIDQVKVQLVTESINVFSDAIAGHGSKPIACLNANSYATRGFISLKIIININAMNGALAEIHEEDLILDSVIMADAMKQQQNKLIETGVGPLSETQEMMDEEQHQTRLIQTVVRDVKISHAEAVDEHDKEREREGKEGKVSENCSSTDEEEHSSYEGESRSLEEESESDKERVIEGSSSYGYEDDDSDEDDEEIAKQLAKSMKVHLPEVLSKKNTSSTKHARGLGFTFKIKGPEKLENSSLQLEESKSKSPPVRRASANVVSVVAKYAVPAGEWSELLPFLFQCSQRACRQCLKTSPFRMKLSLLSWNVRGMTIPGRKQVALILFSSLTETIGDVLRPHFAMLQSVFVKCLQDESSNRVRIAALKAVGSFVEYIQTENEVLMFRELIPSILNVSRQCLAKGDEEVAIIAFEIFDELVESPAPVLGSSVLPIVQFALEVCSTKDLEANTRHQAIQIISWLAKYKPKSLIKHKLVTAILAVMCPLLAEANHRDEDDDLSAERAAAEVLDTMADPEQMVRGSASFTLGQFAEHLQPEIVAHYEIVLPCILTALGDVSEEVQEKAYYALAAFCEHMGEEILPYLDPLMAKLLEALHSNRRDLQETCMSAIGSAAAAAELAFIPYAERVLELMKIFMVLTKDEDLRARARATELVGIIAMAVGRPRIEPILPPFIDDNIVQGSIELREYTHGFFSNIAEVMDEGFTQYLPRVVPLAFASCNLDDGSAVDIDDSDGDDTANGFGDLLTATQEAFPSTNHLSPETKHVLDTVMDLYIRAMHEDDDKEVVSQACMCAAEIIKAFGYSAMEPYIVPLSEATLELLRQEASCQQTGDTDSDIDDDDCEHDEVLMDSVTDLLPALAKCMGSQFLPIFSRLFEPLMKFAKASRPPEDRTMVVACLAEVAQEMGSPITQYIDNVMPLVLKELASSEAANRRNAAFCVGELCKNGGEATLKYYNNILCALYPLFGETETDDAVRDNAAGAVARMIMAQPHAIPLSQVLPVLVKALPLKDDLEESLAVYSCLCNLILSSKPEILSLVPQVVQIFAQVAASPAESSEVKSGIGMAFSHLLSHYGDQMQPILNSLAPQHANALASFITRS